MPDEIDQILNSYHVDALWDMAEAAGINALANGKRAKKDHLLAKLRSEFFEAARIRASWKRLDKQALAVLNLLLRHAQPVLALQFAKEVQRQGLAEPGDPSSRGYIAYRQVPYAYGDYIGDPHRANTQAFEDIIARLTYHGLVFSQLQPGSGHGIPPRIQFHPAYTLYVPDVIRRHLPHGDPGSLPAPSWQPEQIYVGKPDVLLRNLYLYWDFVRQNDVNLLQNGLIGKRWLKAISRVLLTPDTTVDDAPNEMETGLLAALGQLAAALGLVQRTESHILVTGDDRRQLPEFWLHSEDEQIADCLRVWCPPEAADSRSDIALYGQRTLHARQMLLNTLKTISQGIWVDIHDFVALVQGQEVDFLYSEHSQVLKQRGSWYYSPTGSGFAGDPKTVLKQIESFETEFVAASFSSFLASIGMVDAGYIGGKFRGFRLTARGMVLLGRPGAIESAAHVETGKLVIQPNYQVLALGPVSLAILAQLDLFAERVRADQGVLEYHLSRDSLYRAQQIGMRVAETITFLEKTSATPLPQNVRRSLEEWGAGYERIVFRTGVTLLQVADAEMLRTVTNDPHVNTYIARPLGAEVALVKKDQQKALIADLIARGLFPAIAGAQPSSADHSVAIHEDGTIRPLHAVTNLHLRGRLARFAIDLGDGTWQLSPTLVRRAGGSRAKVLHLLDELAKLQSGALPGKLIMDIKAWGSYFGSAKVGKITLVEFRDQEALNELCQNPDLRGLLTPFRAGERALAAVSEEHLAHIQDVLGRLGVPIKEGLH